MFFDDLHALISRYRGGSHIPFSRAFLVYGELEQSVVINIQNVYDYILAGHDHSFEKYLNAAPPWPDFYMEYRRPDGLFEVGTRFLSVDLQNSNVMAYFKSNGFAAEDAEVGGALDVADETFRSAGCRWVYFVACFVRADGVMVNYPFFMGITPEGRLYGERDDEWTFLLPGADNRQWWAKEEADSIAETWNFWGPCFVATTFAHCKNVSLVDGLEEPRNVKRRFERQNGFPMIRHKVLAIDPMRVVVNGREQESEHHVERALHIARGHFKTYSPERPLLGKYHGTFWCPMHVRGSRKAGVVVKDYAFDLRKMVS
jgi:hypothetical protein